MSRNVQFINYGSKRLYEADDNESTSKVNKHEARFVVELAKYFLKNGIPDEKITILTFYLGQFFEIKGLLRKMENRVNINCQTVDNFQGQENDIIILSTVRSNRQKKGGFSLIDNRVCVALSRARNSLFVIGNLDMLSKCPKRDGKKNIWSSIMECTADRGTLVDGVQLACARHPNYTREIEPCDTPDETAKMFSQHFPEGGCTKPCDDRLKCGHTCPLTCHQEDRHETVKCNKICERVCPDNNHKFCKKKCWKDCGPCPILIARLVPSCRHVQEMTCGEKAEDFICKGPCKKILPGCGHKCSSYCGQKCDPAQCTTMRVKTCPDCFFKHEVKCCDFNKNVGCPNPCNTKLACDHICPGTCGKCNKKLLHVDCKIKCDKRLICGHLCERACHGKECPPCIKTCGKRCLHSQCVHRCWEECVPCKEICPSKNCKKRCSDNCEHDKTKSQCTVARPCGHPCFHISHKKINTTEVDFHSKEACPMCNIQIRDRYFDPIMFMEFDEGSLYVYLPDCKHSIEHEGLDGWVSSVMENSELQALTCPKCISPIRQSDRYLKELNSLQNKYEKVKAEYRKLKDVDVKELKTNLISYVKELTEEDKEAGKTHFLGIVLYFIIYEL